MIGLFLGMTMALMVLGGWFIGSRDQTRSEDMWLPSQDQSKASQD